MKNPNLKTILFRIENKVWFFARLRTMESHTYVIRFTNTPRGD